MVLELMDKVGRSKPWVFAHVHLVSGDQGGGKNTTTVARVRDAYDNDCVRVYLKEVKRIEAMVPSVYDSNKDFSCPMILGYDRHSRITKIKYRGDIRIIRIPSDYKLHSPMKIYSVFHLFGIPYKYCTWIDVIKWLNQDILRGTDDCPVYLLLDQFEIVGNAREGMASVARYLEKKSYQFRKRHLEAYVLVPAERLADWTMRGIATERIYCVREGDSTTITVKIRRKGVRGIITHSYDGSQYWRNFWSDDEVPIPDVQMLKALMSLQPAEERE